MSSDQWWTTEDEREFNGEGYTSRARTMGVVWDDHPATDDGRRQYRLWVRVDQTSRDPLPGIGLWLWDGQSPAMTLSVDEARHIGQALADAADLVDRERDAAIRELLDNTP